MPDRMAKAMCCLAPFRGAQVPKYSSRTVLRTPYPWRVKFKNSSNLTHAHTPTPAHTYTPTPTQTHTPTLPHTHTTDTRLEEQPASASYSCTLYLHSARLA